MSRECQDAGWLLINFLRGGRILGSGVAITNKFQGKNMYMYLQKPRLAESSVRTLCSVGSKKSRKGDVDAG